MFDVIVDPDVLERLASRLDLWASQLTSQEWAHLVGLLGVGSAALAEAIRDVNARPLWMEETNTATMSSPGFADALSPAADAVLHRAATGHSVVIISGPEPNRWVVTSSAFQPPNETRQPVGTTTNSDDPPFDTPTRRGR